MKLVRLSCNMNEETAGALEYIATTKGISISEAIRRCIGLYSFFDSETTVGRTIYTDGEDGKREVQLL